MKITYSAKEINKIISKLNHKDGGFVCIEDAIDKKLLNQIKLEIKKYINKNGNPNYLSISNPLKRDFKSFKNLQEKINLIKFTEKLAKKYLNYFLNREEVNKVLKRDKVYSVLRFVSGSKTSMALKGKDFYKLIHLFYFL